MKKLTSTFLSILIVLFSFSSSLIASAESNQLQIDLTRYFNCDAFASNANATDGDFDNNALTIVSDGFPSPIVFAGVTYKLGPISTDKANNAVKAKSPAITIAIPTGHYKQLLLLSSASNGNKTNVPFKVTYSDNSSKDVTLNINDWCNAGPSDAVNNAKRHIWVADGQPFVVDPSHTVYIHQFSIDLDSAKQVSGLVLPVNNNIKIFAVTLIVDPNPPAASATTSKVTSTTTSKATSSVASKAVSSEVSTSSSSSVSSAAASSIEVSSSASTVSSETSSISSSSDTKEEAPPAGPNIPLIVILALVALGIIGAVVFLVMKKRNNK